VKKALSITLIAVVLLVVLPTWVAAIDSPPYIDLTGQRLLATIDVDSANLRSGPGTSYTVIGGAVSGARLSILGMSGIGEDTWYLVQKTTSEEAWVSTSVVQIEQVELAAEYAPDISTMYISIDTSPGFYNRLDELFTIYNRGFGGMSVRGDIDDMIGSLFLNPTLNGDEVRPWLGNEVAIINLQCLSTTMSDFLMTDSLQETPRPSVVIMAHTIDPVAAQAFINRAMNSGTLRNAPRQQVTRSGYTYYLLNDPSQPDYDPDFQPVAMGIIDDFAVFTQGAGSYNAIIDTATGSVPALGASSNFRDVYYQLDNNAFLEVYVAPGLFCPIHEPILYQALLSDRYREGELDLPGVDASAAPAALQEELIAVLDSAFKGYGVSFGGGGDGLEVNVVSGIDVEAITAITGLSAEEVQQRAGQMGLELFGFLRPSAMQGLSFGRMTDGYDELRAMAGMTPDAVFESSTGMSRDLLDWFEGTITMGFIDYPVFAGGGNPTLRPSYFLLILETQDAQLAQEAIARMEQAALNQPGANVESQIVEGVDARSVVNNIGETVQFAAIDNFAILTTGGNLDRVIQNGRQTNDGRFYPDWQLLAGLPQAEAAAAQNPDAAPIVAFLDMGRMMFAGERTLQAEAVMFSKSSGAAQETSDISTRIETAAIVTPADLLAVLEGVDPSTLSEDEQASLITIICRICNTNNC
jgi:hypothetical protein